MHPLPAGLPNLGNTCWLSAAALLLTQLPPSVWRRVGKRSHPLLGLLRALHDARLSGLSPTGPGADWTRTLLVAVAGAGISPGYGSRGRQHDPAELVEYVVSTLLMEDRTTQTVARELLGRSVCFITRCRSCSATLARESQPEFLLHLAVPAAADPITLADCIAAARRSETIEGRCECSAGTPVKLDRRSYEESLPRALVVLLKRTSGDGRKLRTPIKLPRDLALAMRGEASRETARYELHGVVRHRGASTQSGHYVYYGAGRAAWHAYDDETVTTSARLDPALIDRDAVMALYLPLSAGDSSSTAR